MDNNQIIKQRLDYIDIFRAFGIILMVMGHIGFGSIFDKFIHAFHMPMFFFISGFLYKKKDIDTNLYIKKKSRTLLIPYGVFGIFHYAISLKYELSLKPIVHLLTVNTNGLPIAGALWFLTALFWVDIIYYLFDKWNLKWIIIFLICIGSFSDQFLRYPLPWALGPAFVGLGFYWLGHVVRENENRFYLFLNMNWGMIFLIGSLTTGLIFLNGYVNMRIGNYSIIPLFWINAIFSFVIGISISKKIESITKNTFFQKWLISIGRCSIIYVCLNQLIILVSIKITEIFSISSKLFVTIFSFFLLFVLSKIIMETKLRILVGK